MEAVLSLLLGLLLRIGVPVGVSTLVFFLLRRLDERWQKQARAIPVLPAQKPCWEIKGCPQEKRENCPATAQPKVPCWQVYRMKTGQLQQECLGCEVFRLAPALS